MEERPLQDVKLVGRWLSFDPQLLKHNFPIPFGLHFGSGLSPTSHSFFATRVQEGLCEIYAKSGEERIDVFPLYKSQAKTLANEVYGDIELEVWLVNTDIDRLRATNIVSRVHYLPPPTRGLFLACRFADPKVQEEVRKSALDKQRTDDWSGAWSEPVGGMVACASLDTLLFGNPKGREIVASEIYGKPLDELIYDLGLATVNRVSTVRALRLAWGSRFAVDAPYRGLGIGSVLAKELKSVAKRYRAPKPRVIEVITSLRATDTGEFHLPDPANDFLCRAGYQRADSLSYSRPLLEMDVAGNKTRRTPIRKTYYYTDLEL